MTQFLRTVFCGLCILLVLAPMGGRAGTGRVDDLRTTPVGNEPGLQLRVDSRWVDGNGYRPIRLTLSTFPTQPSLRQRHFHIEIVRPEMWRGREYDALRVIDTLVLDEGQSVVEKTVLLPQAELVHQLELRVFEDGERIKALSQRIVAMQATGQPWTEATPAILVVTPKILPLANQPMAPQFAANSGADYNLPDVYTLTSVIPGSPNFGSGTGRVADAAQLGILAQHPKVALLSPQDLPTRWIDLSAVDILFISRDELQTLADSQPQRYDALLQWASVGHTLCVMDVDLSQLTELDQLLGQDPSKFAVTQWEEPDVQRYGIGFKQAEQMLANQFAVVSSWPLPDRIAAPRFRIRNYRLGRVVALDSVDMLSDRPQVAWMLESLEPWNWAWFQRYGISLHRANDSFEGWRIPGVGAPPVVTFLVLLTGFVILIGPVNYVMLQRRKRLYLLLITVPAAALVTTTVLMAYGVFADGLGVRVRARSYTLLDQEHGQQWTWSRQTYYAGLQPSRGLVFDQTAVVMPIFAEPRTYRSRRPSAELLWTNGQNWRRGYLGVRETSQLMVVQAAPSPSRLEIVQDGERLKAQNELGARILALVAVDADQQLWVARNIDAGEQGQLEKKNRDDVSNVLKSGITALSYGTTYYAGGYYWADVDEQVIGPQITSGILERHLARISGLNLAPRSFVAVLAPADWLPTGINTAEHTESVHVVEGRW